LGPPGAATAPLSDRLLGLPAVHVVVSKVAASWSSWERQREGIALAKQRDAYRGRRKSLTGEQAELLTARAAAGISKAQ